MNRRDVFRGLAGLALVGPAAALLGGPEQGADGGQIRMGLRDDAAPRGADVWSTWNVVGEHGPESIVPIQNVITMPRVAPDVALRHLRFGDDDGLSGSLVRA